MILYFISGLGTDERVFNKLQLPVEWQRIYLGWPEFSKDDTVESYAKKYIPLIDTTNEFVLLGLSFGGMIISELSKILNPKRSILISSLSNADELPAMLHFTRITNLENLIPDSFFKVVPPFLEWYMGIHSEEEKILMRDFLKNSSPEFLRWAIYAISNWKNKMRSENIFHIHGDNDHVLPFEKVKADHVIKGGGHFMVFNKAEEVSKVILEALK